MIDYRILGPVEVSADGRVIDIGGPRLRRLLAILLLRANEPVPRGILVQDLWGDQPPAGAQGSLEVYVSRLRKALGSPVLLTGRVRTACGSATRSWTRKGSNGWSGRAGASSRRTSRDRPPRACTRRSSSGAAPPSATSVASRSRRSRPGGWRNSGSAGDGSHRGGTLTIATPATIDTSAPATSASIDPAFFYYAFNPQFGGLAYDGLVTFQRSAGADGLRLVPDLAVAIPAPSDDGATYTFRIRPRIRYSDGQALRAGDFRRAIERLFRVGSPGRSLYAAWPAPPRAPIARRAATCPAASSPTTSPGRSPSTSPRPTPSSCSG